MKSFQTAASVHILNGIYSMRRDCDAWCEINAVNSEMDFKIFIIQYCIAALHSHESA